MRRDLVTTTRFPEVPSSAGHYESLYVKACHPTEPMAVWIRYTVHRRPHKPMSGSLWFTLFDAREERPWAVKATTYCPDVPSGHYIRIGKATFKPGALRGSAVTKEGLEASWNLEFECDEEPWRHLPRDVMYNARLPRTKLLSPYPDARFSGLLTAGERVLQLDGWRGMVGHNWGAQHAERWIWIHAAGFDELPDAWLDIALGRIKVGPFKTPWIANGVLSLGGVRHRLGGPGRILKTKVDEEPDRCKITVIGDELVIDAQVGAERKDFVGWVYADPDGSEHNTVNCSVADIDLTVGYPVGNAETVLTARGSATYELGMRETDHGMAIEPFPDG